VNLLPYISAGEPIEDCCKERSPFAVEMGPVYPMVVVAEICAVPSVVFGSPMPSPPVKYPEPLTERVVTGDVVPPMPILELSPSNESNDDPPSGVNENAWFVEGIVVVADDMKVKAEGWLKLMKFEPRKIEPEPV